VSDPVILSTAPTPSEVSQHPARIEVEIQRIERDAELLVPTGIATPHDRIAGVEVHGGVIKGYVAAQGLGLGALVVQPTAAAIGITYAIAAPTDAGYPEDAFRQRRTRYTVASPALAAASRAIVSAAGGGRQAIQALAEETQARFAYDHPPRKFNEGHETMPLVRGITPGSCIDIHSYFVASLRVTGFDAAYLYGYYFAEAGDGIARDMHCWVVTRHGGELLEWDIAQHSKMGLGTVRPALSPLPGRRVAIGHSMAHRYALAAGEIELKLLAKPQWIFAGGTAPPEGLAIRISDRLFASKSAGAAGSAARSTAGRQADPVRSL
jgi:hypothetical protein